MNREIKFRGLCNGKWVYGDLITIIDDDGNKVLKIQKHNLYKTETFDVDIESIGQFTGIKDVNGKEIYEGDYFLRSNMKKQVKWEISETYMGLNIGVSTKKKAFPITIIGNVYENPSIMGNKYYRDAKKIPKPIDFVFSGSKLTFIKNEYFKNGYWYALYRCECGVEKIIAVPNVKNGRIKSCGCLKLFKYKNGINRRLYAVWTQMISRCYNTTHVCYKTYGGRGVTVCNEWREDYMSFQKWAFANGWKQGLVIDKDIKALKLGILPSYSPELCSVVTQKENTKSENRTRHKKLSVF